MSAWSCTLPKAESGPQKQIGGAPNFRHWHGQGQKCVLPCYNTSKTSNFTILLITSHNPEGLVVSTYNTARVDIIGICCTCSCQLLELLGSERILTAWKWMDRSLTQPDKYVHQRCLDTTNMRLKRIKQLKYQLQSGNIAMEWKINIPKKTQ